MCVYNIISVYLACRCGDNDNMIYVQLTDNGWLARDLNWDAGGGGGRLFGVSAVGLLMRTGCKVCGDGDGDARNWLNYNMP